MSNAAELKKIPLLSALSGDELERLSDVAIRRSVSRGTYLIHEQDDGLSLMFISEGTVNVTLVGSEGKEVVICQLGRGEYFGEISVLTGHERSANVVAASDCVVFVLSKESFENHILSNNGLALALMQTLAERLRQSTGKIGDLMLLDVYRRVATTLRRLAKPQMVEGNKVLIIEDRPTHQELANMVGTSREMVTRVLKGLEEDEYIQIDGKRIQVFAVPL